MVCSVLHEAWSPHLASRRVSTQHLKLYVCCSYVLSQHKHSSDKRKQPEFRTSSALGGMKKTNCSCPGANEAWFSMDVCVLVG